MDLQKFKERFGHNISGIWLPRVTAILSLVPKPNLYSILKSKPTLISFYFQNSALWGQKVHREIQNYFLKEEVSSEFAFLTPFLENFKKEFNFIPFKESKELLVLDLENFYSGKIDLIGEIRGERGILEIKTTSKILSEFHLQTAAYLKALQKSFPEIEALKRWILRVEIFKECKGCRAKLIKKGNLERVSGGVKVCNHYWTDFKANLDLVEVKNSSLNFDFRAFLNAKSLWEWYFKDILVKIDDYPNKNILWNT